MSIKTSIFRLASLGVSAFLLVAPVAVRAETGGAAGPSSLKPNVLWISSEDHGQEMGCYGDAFADTPNVDSLARRGLMYRNVWSNAPVCAPARTTIITGMYPAALGAEHMRSMVTLPPNVKLFPQALRDAGYYCTNNNKEDYNVRTPKELWDESSRDAHYKKRKPGQPFFAVFNSTVSHESSIRNFKGTLKHDPALVTVPAYHPDHPTVRRDWAIYYDTVSSADAIAGKHLAELAAAGLAESTIVFYWGDHGSGMPRHKRWPSDSGLRVPLIVYIPEAYKHLRPEDYAVGGETDRPVSFVDFAPTMLSLAGIEPPSWMHGHAFLGPYAAPKQPYVYGFRGRMDERLDLVRSVTDGRYVYIKNYMPHLSQGQHVAYQMETATTRLWRQLYDEGKLNDQQSQFWQEPKASEEFYDLQADRYEVNNLVGSPEHSETLEQFRAAHRDHLFRIRDLGFVPEGDRFVLAGGKTFYEYGGDMRAYPLGRIFDAAQLASAINDQSEEAIMRLVKWTEDENRVLRYWGAMGLRMRGEKIVRSHTQQLVGLMSDSSPAVQVVAAQSLALYGTGEVRQAAIERLLSRANWTNNDVFTTMGALAALESIGPGIAEYAATINQLPTRGISPDGRYNSYVPRLHENLVELVIKR